MKKLLEVAEKGYYESINYNKTQQIGEKIQKSYETIKERLNLDIYISNNTKQYTDDRLKSVSSGINIKDINEDYNGVLNFSTLITKPNEITFSFKTSSPKDMLYAAEIAQKIKEIYQLSML